MKYIHQFLIIMLISFVGELLSFLPLPIPASVYGLLIMLVGLYTKIIPLSAIEDVADWLILIMPVLFVPSAVGLMNIKEELFENSHCDGSDRESCTIYDRKEKYQ